MDSNELVWNAALWKLFGTENGCAEDEHVTSFLMKHYKDATFSFGKIVIDESCKQGTCIKTGVNLDVMSTSSALRGTYHCELMGDHRC